MDNLSFVKVWPCLYVFVYLWAIATQSLNPHSFRQALTWFLSHLLFKRRRMVITDEIYELYCGYQ
jgi:hypothetical protein